MAEQSQIIKEQIETIKTTFLSVLDDYKKYYVFVNVHPEVEEYQRYYEQTTSQLSLLVKKLMDISNGINEKIKELNDETSYTYNQLSKETKKYDKLTKLLNGLTMTKNGTEILIDDFKEQYNKQYYYNVEMILGILLVSGLIKYTFSE